MLGNTSTADRIFELRDEIEQAEREIAAMEEACTARKDGLITARRAQVERLRSDYKKVYAATLAASGGLLEEGERLGALTVAERDATARYQASRERSARLLLAAEDADSDEERRRAYSEAESRLAIARGEQEIIEELRQREIARRVRAGDSTFTPGRINGGTTARLSELLDRIGGNYVEEPNLPTWKLPYGFRPSPSDEEREVEIWLRTLERDADIAEYSRVARGGLMVDPATGDPLERFERQRAARNALVQLAECLRLNDRDPSVLLAVLGAGDTRAALGQSLQEDLNASDEYRALDYITPGMAPEMPEVFRALALVVRNEQDRVNTARADYIPEGGDGGFTGWLYENFVAKQQIGLGKGMAIGEVGIGPLSIGGSGEESLEAVDRRIAAFNTEADVVADAFTAAAGGGGRPGLTPAELDPEHYTLLKAFGYIGMGPDGQETYQIPRGSLQATGGLAEGTGLPGASWLDVVSGENAIKAAVMLAAPELVGARAALLLEEAGVGAAAIWSGRVAADVLTGISLDAADQVIARARVSDDPWEVLLNPGDAINAE